MSASTAEAELVEQIRALVEQELSRTGQRGAPRVEGSWLVSGRGAAELRAEIAGSVAQWQNLPQDLRDKRIVQIAQLLSPGLAAAQAAPRVKPRTRRASWFSGFAPLGIALATGAVLILAYRYLTPNGSSLAGLRQLLQGAPRASASVVPAPRDPDRERALLASSACDQSRSRVTRGANIGPADVEGWVVELVLLRRSGFGNLMTSPALAKLIRTKPGLSEGVVIWPGARTLMEAKRFDAKVDVRPVAALGANHLTGLSLVFSGPYVIPYFTETERADYFMLADALTEALQFTDGALFAHCADAEAHQIGAWFLGATPAAALSSVVYFMADFSAAPLLSPAVLGAASDPLRHGHAFDAINAAAAGLDRSAVAALIGNELGMLSGRPNQPLRLTFPFRDANRATRASIAAARALKLANSG